MRKIKLFCLIVVSVFVSSLAYAKECPSLAYSNMREISDWGLFVGVEARGFFFYSTERDYENDIRVTNKYVFLGVKGVAEYDITDNLYINLDAEVKGKNVATCYYDTGPHFFLKALNLAGDFKHFSFTLGRQNFVFGTQAILDNWFDGGYFTYKSKKVDVSLFGGVFIPYLAREMSGCMLETIYEYRGGYKKLCTSDWGDDLALGLIFNLKFLKRLKIMFLKQKSNHEELDNYFLSIFHSGKLFFSWLSYFVEGIYYYRDENNHFPAIVLYLAPHFKVKKFWFNMKFGLLSVFTGDNPTQHITPIFETLHLGERYRFSLFNGNVMFAKLKIKTPLKFLRFKTAYYIQSRKLGYEPISDELDTGFIIDIKHKYKMWLIYSLLNITGDYDYIHQVMVQLRATL